MDAQGGLITFTLNGHEVSARIAPHHTLVEVLRNEFGLYGARESCGQGLCGCCTVTVDGLPVSACLYLAALVDGCAVRTIEDAAENGELSRVQQAFVECGAFQCGFCTPGFIMMSTELLRLHPDPDEEQIKDYLCGNLCRCAAYPQIVQAVRLAATRQRQQAEQDKDADRERQIHH